MGVVVNASEKERRAPMELSARFSAELGAATSDEDEQEELAAILRRNQRSNPGQRLALLSGALGDSADHSDSEGSNLSTMLDNIGARHRYPFVPAAPHPAEAKYDQQPQQDDALDAEMPIGRMDRTLDSLEHRGVRDDDDYDDDARDDEEDLSDSPSERALRLDVERAQRRKQQLVADSLAGAHAGAQSGKASKAKSKSTAKNKQTKGEKKSNKGKSNKGKRNKDKKESNKAAKKSGKIKEDEDSEEDDSDERGARVKAKHHHVFVRSPDVDHGLKALEVAIRKSQEKGEVKAVAVHYGFSAVLTLLFVGYFTGTLLVHLNMYSLRDTYQWAYTVNSLILMVLGGVCFLASLLALWLGLTCYCRTVVISQFFSLALFLVAGALDLPTREFYWTTELLVGLVLLLVATCIHIVVLLLLLLGGIRSDAQIYPSLTTVKQLEQASFLVRTAEKDRRKEQEQADHLKRRLDRNTRQLKDQLLETRMTSDRLREELDQAQQELLEMRRTRKEFELAKDKAALAKSHQVMDAQELRHEEALLVGRREVQEMLPQVAKLKSERNQLEQMHVDKLSQVQKLQQEMDAVKEENRRITNKNKNALESSMFEVRGVVADRDNLVKELKDFQKHHAKVVAELNVRQCTDCAIQKAKLGRVMEALDEVQSKGYPHQIEKLQKTVKAAKHTISNLRQENHLIKSVHTSRVESLKDQVLDFDHYLRDCTNTAPHPLP